MRCHSCGLLNTAQVLECVGCKSILDPIAAIATVSVFSEAAVGPTLDQSLPMPLNQNPNMPPRPPLSNLVGATILTQPATVARPQKGRWSPPPSAELEFLVEATEISARVKQNEARPGSSQSQAVPATARCPSCHRVVEADKMVLAASGTHRSICRDCTARQASKETAAPQTQARRRFMIALAVGAATVLAAIIFAAQFGLTPDRRDINWPFGLVVGIVIGLAVRIGAANQPSGQLQWLGLGLSLVAVVGCLYVCLNSITHSVLAPDAALEAFKTLSPDILKLAFPLVGMLLAFVIPSGMVGGGTRETAH